MRDKKNKRKRRLTKRVSAVFLLCVSLYIGGCDFSERDIETLPEPTVMQEETAKNPVGDEDKKKAVEDDSYFPEKAPEEKKTKLPPREEAVSEDNFIEEVASQTSIIGQGSCGDGVYYVLESSGTLTIKGKGEIGTGDWSGARADWKEKAMEVIIEYGVTGIGDHAFEYCGNIRAVQIPDSVKTIGSYAFNGCTRLEMVWIPSGLYRMEIYAFANCTNLKSVSIGNGISRIEQGTFERCYNLLDVCLPDSVKEIEPYAFAHCDYLESITYTGTQAQWEQIVCGAENAPIRNAKIYVNRT